MAAVGKALNRIALASAALGVTGWALEQTLYTGNCRSLLRGHHSVAGTVLSPSSGRGSWRRSRAPSHTRPSLVGVTPSSLTSPAVRTMACCRTRTIVAWHVSPTAVVAAACAVWCQPSALLALANVCVQGGDVGWWPPLPRCIPVEMRTIAASAHWTVRC